MKINIKKKEYTYVYFKRISTLSKNKSYLSKDWQWVNLKNAYVFSDNPLYDNKSYNTANSLTVTGRPINFTLKDAIDLKEKLDDKNCIHELVNVDTELINNREEH